MNTDCISREYVLQRYKAICNLCGDYKKYGRTICGGLCLLDGAIKIVEDANSVNSTKVGHWIDVSSDDDMDGFYCCSLCKREIVLYPGETLKDYPYCHCGADMEV